MLVAVDLETGCNVGCTKKCDHALVPWKSKILCVGVWTPEEHFVLRDREAIEEFFADPSFEYVGHNFKFDLKTLHFHGIKVAGRWAHDSQVMASASLTKVSKEYLEWYETRRKELNKGLKKSGHSHREGKRLSLKVLAPFFLGVDPFWETPGNHDDDEYVLKDCEYSYRMYQFFKEKLEAEGLTSFYETWLMPKARMLLDVECAGIAIDIPLLKKMQAEAEETAAELKGWLDEIWAPVYLHYQGEQELALHFEYEEKLEKFLASRPAADRDKAQKRYDELFRKACLKLPTTMNLDSPKQLAWIFKDYFGLDITDPEGEETTGVEVLNRLVAQGRTDIEIFVAYREQQKLATAFFPSYLEIQREGALHCNFNIDGTRTGRLSSSSPNLQQVPGDLHKLFVARPGYKLAAYDMSAIEAKVIAYYTQDRKLVKLVNSGKDFHGTNVAEVYFPELKVKPEDVKKTRPKERDFSKTLGYGLFYGSGAPRVQTISQNHAFNWEMRRCKESVQRFRFLYSEVYDFKDELDRLALTEPIENYFGRKASYPDPTEIYMKAFNTLIQSTASDLVLDAAYRIERFFSEFGIKGGVRLLVHDELVVEFEEAKEKQAVEIIEHCMTDYELPTNYGDIKLEVEGRVGGCWLK